MKKNTSVAWRPIDATTLDLKGKKAIVVGGTGGLGRAIARLLAARGAEVVVVGQNFRDAGAANIKFVQADLSLLSEAQRIARELLAATADLLLFTTGIFASPQRQSTREGVERDMAVSYLNRLVMLREMAPRLGVHRPSGSIKARVFNMAYPGTGQLGAPDDLNGERSYKAMAQHMNTVAGNEILVLEGARRYPHLDVFGLNPGVVKTNIRSNWMGHKRLLFAALEGMIGFFSPTPDQYAVRIVPLLATPDIEGRSGALFDKTAQAILPSDGMTEGFCETFLAASEALVTRAGVSLAH
ncbi:NAD(P)-dependent dehydrogenase (short-subunit alcohol dehydrogenase family) [Rhodoblastus acidophilus]|uniref:SDR family NAD(P)-dependent oxidoreductase n=1 Tax=Rhodoblastus acidophilus TaxID=1074 RepID=UPI002224CF12|nr:SDR family NAD(P)-dependent oxidoreductase [Rhodoblastus acidophilus]MCW2319005.1 NAD(P)-dependent dehydrogenase (short-subunit alcohol dehydrogenase family) [Rhodoblastus acidophilus]